MPKIYKKSDDRYLHMTEVGGFVDIGVVDSSGNGLGCLIQVHNTNQVELVRYNSTEVSGMVLSNLGTIIPTVNLGNPIGKMVKKASDDTLLVCCLNNAKLDLGFAEKLAFSLLNLCYEMRKDAKG